MVNNLKTEKRSPLLWGPPNEKHIRELLYSAEDNRRKTARQTMKETGLARNDTIR